MSEQRSGRAIRAFVDGELPPQEAASVESDARDDGELRASIEFERHLRTSVGRVMAEVASPAKLRSRVEERLVRRSWWAGPRRANAFAVAASIALVAGAVLFGIFGQPIDTVRRGFTGGAASEAARHVSSEHHRCAATGDALFSKIRWTEMTEAAEALREHLGTPVPVPSLADAGFRFIGAGPCAVPGSRRSAHLIYARPQPASDGCPSTTLSLFVVVTGDPGSVAPDEWLWSVAAEPPVTEKMVACTVRGPLTYFLVSCEESSLADMAHLIADRSGD